MPPMRSTTGVRFLRGGCIDGLNLNGRACRHDSFDGGLRQRSWLPINGYPFDLTVRIVVRTVTVPLWTIAGPLRGTTVAVKGHSGGAGDKSCYNDCVTHLDVYVVCWIVDLGFSSDGY